MENKISELLDWCEQSVEKNVDLPSDLVKMFTDWVNTEDKESIRDELNPPPTKKDDARMAELLTKINGKK